MKIGIPQSNFHCESHSQTGVSLFAIRSHHCCNSSKGRRKNVVRSKRKIHSISCCALKSRKKPFRGHFRCYLTNVKLDSFLSQLQQKKVPALEMINWLHCYLRFHGFYYINAFPLKRLSFYSGPGRLDEQCAHRCKMQICITKWRPLLIVISEFWLFTYSLR